MLKIIDLGDNMKINRIHLENVGNISNLTLNFNESMNVICGTNGIGKTTILKSVAACFSDGGQGIKKKYGSNIGKINLSLTNSDSITDELNVNVDAIKPLEMYEPDRINRTLYLELINFSIDRSINYKEITSLKKYPGREFWQSKDIVKEGIKSEDLKNWLVNRYMSSGHWDDLEEYEQENYNLMKNVFSIINPDIKFKKADTKNYEIVLDDRGSEVYFEFESAGYKAIVYILLGIISEIEFRMENKQATGFSGVVLIDEIDMHLHPEWQRRVVHALKKTFPKAQFIITTHSPSVLQDLNKDEIIPLALNESKDVEIKELDLSEYGLKGWSLEEILSDVMGVENVKSNEYLDIKEKFELALEDGDEHKLKESYAILEKMLHPTNPLKQILEIQMAGIVND